MIFANLSMSGLQIETVSNENLSTQFMPFSNNEDSADGVPESVAHDRYNRSSFDLHEWNLLLDTPQVGGDAKPPLRLSNVSPPKTSAEILAILNEKQRQTSLRRDKYIANIIERSRRYSDRVQRVRDKMAVQQKESSQNIEKTLRDKRKTAERIRERVSQSKLERIRTLMEHALVVRNRKLMNDDYHSTAGSCSSSKPSPVPQAKHHDTDMQLGKHS